MERKEARRPISQREEDEDVKMGSVSRAISLAVSLIHYFFFIQSHFKRAFYAEHCHPDLGLMVYHLSVEEKSEGINKSPKIHGYAVAEMQRSRGTGEVQ